MSNPGIREMTKSRVRYIESVLQVTGGLLWGLTTSEICFEGLIQGMFDDTRLGKLLLLEGYP
jgi:hypothetical protein